MTIAKLIVSAGLMGIVVWYTNTQAHFIVAILAGALVYIGMLFVTRTITKQQLREGLRLISN